MRTHHGYVMQDQVKAKVPAIMAYRFRHPVPSAGALPRPALLVLTVIGLNILISALST